MAGMTLLEIVDGNAGTYTLPTLGLLILFVVGCLRSLA